MLAEISASANDYCMFSERFPQSMPQFKLQDCSFVLACHNILVRGVVSMKHRYKPLNPSNQIE